MMAESRYQPIVKLAAGGMATVFVGTARGAMGFRQLVALKKPHAHLLEDPTYRRELVAEARLASLIHHANVVDVRDIEIEGDDVTLVMDYIEGASLADLLGVGLRGGPRVPPSVAVRIILDACAGLHAAHDVVDEKGRPVGLIHRDVSPQNLLIGLDGMTRVSDFGVAKLSGGQKTTEGTLKGKLAYMAPEYVRDEPIDRRSDVFATAVVLWEALAYERLFRGSHDADTLRKVLELQPPKISARDPALSALDAVLETALAKDPAQRFATAQAFATGLEAVARPAGLVAAHAEVAEIVRALVGDVLEARRVLVRKQMSEEPSLLSFLNGQKPTELAALDAPKLNPDFVSTLAPPTKPIANTLPIDASPQVAPAPPPVSVTRPLAPLPPAVATARTSFSPGEEAPRPSIASAMPRSRSRAVPIALALVALAAVGGGATWFVMRPQAPASAATTTAALTTGAPPVSLATSVDDAPLASLSIPSASAHGGSVSPSSTHATLVVPPSASATAVAPVDPVGSAPRHRRRRPP